MAQNCYNSKPDMMVCSGFSRTAPLRIATISESCFRTCISPIITDIMFHIIHMRSHNTFYLKILLNILRPYYKLYMYIFLKNISHRNLAGSFSLLVANLGVSSTFDEQSRQLSSTHRCRYVQGCVPVLMIMAMIIMIMLFIITIMIYEL